MLAENFNKMIVHLKEMASVSAAIAEGQLSVTVQPRSQQDTMAQAFARMTQGLRDIVRQVRDSASQVASGAGQMASASDESAKVSVQAASAIDEVTSTMHEMSINVQNVVKNTQVQASSVAETSASIDQMVTSIQRVADTAKLLVDISHRSREEAQTGIGTMDKATDGLNRTSHAIQSSAAIIDVLGRRADDIGKIIEVIDDLAEQTNLLALNAAIEAARAGEHGLGFAVVAEEVRKLAEKSTQSTKEISDLIEGIQKEAREAVENMEKSTTMVQEGLVLNKDLSMALEKISDVVSEVYKFSQEIGAATMEQSSGSTQIAKATNRLTEITQEINSSVEEQASGAQAVVRAMEKMRELVQQSTSSSTELAAAAEQMSKLSRSLLDSMDRFVLDELVCRGTPRPGASSGRRFRPPYRRGRICRIGPVLRRGSTMDKDLQIVGFRIGRETFGLPISLVREIVRVPEITPVPNAPDYIEGVINLRGRIIPVVDLRKRFGEKASEPSKKNRIVVVELEDRAIGLMVNSASEVLRIPPSEIEARTMSFRKAKLDYITGVGKLNGRWLSCST